MCDKPLAFDLDEAKELAGLVERTGLLFGLTHNYTGYPLVKEARDIVRGGRLGRIRKVVVEYPQGWLASRLEESGQKQADWRTDPQRAGISCCMGDIGTHAENLAEYVTGLEIEELAADLTTFVSGRPLDDDGSVLLRFHGGAKGVLLASQISAGEENNLKIRVYGESGGLEWNHADPNTLTLRWLDRPWEILRAGQGWLGARARRNTRLPAGHPEGFVEAFANLYRNFAAAIRARLEGREPDADECDFPGVREGVRGMAFIEAVVASSQNNAAWTPLGN
jgi:predicted dehydrogenase